MVDYGTTLEFDYINYKGIGGHRKVEVEKVFYGATSYHPQPQWLMEAWNVNKGEFRIFAMKDMENVVEVK